MKIYGKNFLVFVLIFLPIYIFSYGLIILKLKKPQLIKNMLLGIKEGLVSKI